MSDDDDSDKSAKYPPELYFVAAVWIILGGFCWYFSMLYVFKPQAHDSCCMAFTLPGAMFMIGALRLLMGYALGTMVYFVISLFLCLPALIVMILAAAIGGESLVPFIAFLLLMVMFVTASLAAACQQDYQKWKREHRRRIEEEYGEDDS